MAEAQQRSVVVTESNITHITQAIRDGRTVIHGFNLVEREGCEISARIDESSREALADSLALVYFDPCCQFLSLILSDQSDRPSRDVT